MSSLKQKLKKVSIYTSLLLLLAACGGSKKTIEKNARAILSSKLYENHFTGLVVIDSKNQDTLLNYNGKKYFTPASNTKIFTLFATLNTLPDSIPALRYMTRNDTLFIEGTGDPTLLHSAFTYNTTLDFIKRYPNIVLVSNNLFDEVYGPGWSWDDYHYYYQPEKSSFPIYGNVLTMHNQGGLQVIPEYFKDSVLSINSSKNRSENSNTFYFDRTRNDTLEVPFKLNGSLTKLLLEAAIGRSIGLTSAMPKGNSKLKYSVPTDSVLKRMMHQSDNFLAEQLLIMASTTLSDTLDGRKAQAHILDNQLSDLAQRPRWVDGSGLSRYNLFTPESLVHTLNQLYHQVPQERLFSFFTPMGVSNSEPYIYAKSGSLGNNYCLSGYLLTKSGKTLIFSFMNNHFTEPTSEVKKRMQELFEVIRYSY